MIRIVVILGLLLIIINFIQGNFHREVENNIDSSNIIFDEDSIILDEEYHHSLHNIESFLNGCHFPSTMMNIHELAVHITNVGTKDYGHLTEIDPEDLLEIPQLGRLNAMLIVQCVCNRYIYELDFEAKLVQDEVKKMRRIKGREYKEIKPIRNIKDGICGKKGKRNKNYEKDISQGPLYFEYDYISKHVRKTVKKKKTVKILAHRNNEL